MEISMNNLKKKSLISLLCLVLLIILMNLPVWGSGEKGEAEHGVKFWKEAWKWINFIILVSILYKFLSKPAREFLSTRVENIKRMLTGSRDALKEAEKKLKEAEAVLEGLGKEIEGIRINAKRVRDLEKERIAKETEEVSRKIAEQTKNDIEQLYRKSKKYISNELITQAIKVSEESLKKEFTRDNQKILVKKYIDALEELS